MLVSTTIGALALSLATSVFCTPIADANSAPQERSQLWGNTEFVKRDAVIKPKMFIISMFPPEASVWFGIPEFDLYGQNITLPGLSPLFPEVHCTADGDVCQFTIGESGE
jgi:purine nucleoside permease